MSTTNEGTTLPRRPRPDHLSHINVAPVNLPEHPFDQRTTPKRALFFTFYLVLVAPFAFPFDGAFFHTFVGGVAVLGGGLITLHLIFYSLCFHFDNIAYVVGGRVRINAPQ